MRCIPMYVLLNSNPTIWLFYFYPTLPLALYLRLMLRKSLCLGARQLNSKQYVKEIGVSKILIPVRMDMFDLYVVID